MTRRSKTTSTWRNRRLRAISARRREFVRAILIGGILGRLAAPAPAGAAKQQTGGCDASPNGNFAFSGNPRFAATFAAAKGGRLSRLEITIDKTVGSTGDFVVQLLAVNQDTGEPTNTILAAKKIPNDKVPEGQLQTVAAHFKKRKTTKLVPGTLYAAVITRPNGSGTQHDFAARTSSPDSCLDNRFWVSGTQTGSFAEFANVDMPFTAFVGF